MVQIPLLFKALDLGQLILSINMITGTNDAINNLTEAILPDSQMLISSGKNTRALSMGKRINTLILIY
jgi:hypothetical protein